MKRYRKFKPQSWKKFLDPLRMKLEMNIDEAYILHGRNNFVLLTNGVGVLISNVGTTVENGFRFLPKRFCKWEYLPRFLRRYEISRHLTPCRILGGGDIGEFQFNFGTPLPRGSRIKSKSISRAGSNSSDL